MNDCRVQAARKRKGLADYPCKSGGLVEYRSFAETIDPRIRTSCIACPPDDHPRRVVLRLALHAESAGEPFAAAVSDGSA